MPIKSVLASTIFCLLLLPSLCSAQSYLISVDTPPRLLSAVTNGVGITIRSSNARSYCCSVLPALLTGSPEFTSTSNFNGIPVVERGTDLPAVANSANRYCWTEAAQIGIYNAARILNFGNITGSTDVLASCNETTLYGNYNTSVSEFNFLEMTARFTETPLVSGTIFFRSAVTGNVTTTPFTMAPTGSSDTTRRDFSVHDLLGNIADFGDIKISHDAAPGQLSARIAQYDVLSLSPLDFRLVGQDQLRRGSGLD